MNDQKKKRLEERGWRTGTADDFLGEVCGAPKKEPSPNTYSPDALTKDYADSTRWLIVIGVMGVVAIFVLLAFFFGLLLSLP